MLGAAAHIRSEKENSRARIGLISEANFIATFNCCRLTS